MDVIDIRQVVDRGGRIRQKSSRNNGHRRILAAADAHFTFQAETRGRVLDTSEVREKLYHMVATMTSGTVELEPEPVEPDTKLEDLQKHYMLRSSVYTPISTSSENDRNNNIRRALEMVNGYILNPGSQFSFNGVVGERTEANGFFPAIE